MHPFSGGIERALVAGRFFSAAAAAARTEALGVVEAARPPAAQTAASPVSDLPSWSAAETRTRKSRAALQLTDQLVQAREGLAAHAGRSRKQQSEQETARGECGPSTRCINVLGRTYLIICLRHRRLASSIESRAAVTVKCAR